MTISTLWFDWHGYMYCLPVCGVSVWDEVPVQHKFLDNFLSVITRLQWGPAQTCHLTWKRTEWSPSSPPQSGCRTSQSKMSAGEAGCLQFCSLPGSANENGHISLSSSLAWRLTVNKDFLIWLMLHRITEGKYTSDKEAVVVAMVVTTVLLVKSWMEAWRKIVATAREAKTIINQRILPPDSTWWYL